ncbi:lantibiotic dehydratase [Sorangium sp. So ce834]|uniref:lantibiotic dehydratase n=1 Tax=Sorangium sp. So ce834 TaxID=3133321 RepID=UPI003F600A78
MLGADAAIEVGKLPREHRDSMAAPVRSAPWRAALPGSEWEVWRTVCLRSAGFPVDLLRALVAPGSAAAADRLGEADRAEERSRRAAIAALDALVRVDPRTGVDALAGDEAARARLKAERRRLAKGGAPRDKAGSPAADAALDELAGALRRRDAAGAELRDVFDDEARIVSERLRGICRDRAFREALVWQNRQVLRTAVDPLLAAPEGAADARTRSKERLVASYLERYCAKNDSIGFFGPFGWARIDGGPVAARVAPGRGLLANRTVSMEHWVLDGLAAAIAARPGVAPWLAPRWLPFYQLDGRELILPIGHRAELPPARARLLAACDGVRPARAIAAELLADASLGFSSEAEVYDLLRDMVGMRVLAWDLELPYALRDPEAHLRAALARIEPEDLRAPALAAVDELFAARAAVAAAAGDPEALDRALDALEHTVTRLTAGPATRAPGAVYAGRTPIYEDCRRDVEVTFGAPFLERFGPALSLVLSSMRWFMRETTEAYIGYVRGVVDELVGGAPDARLDMTVLQRALLDRMKPGVFTPPVQRHVDAVRERWKELVGAAPDARRVELDSAALRARFEAAFPSHPADRTVAPFHVSPDLLVAAASPEAFAAGDFLAVLGEVHLGPTLNAFATLSQHPSPGDITAALVGDHPWPALYVTGHKQELLGGPTGQRVFGAPEARRPIDYVLDFSTSPQSIDPEHHLRIADLEVVIEGDRFRAQTRDGRLVFHARQFMWLIISLEATRGFSLFAPARHVPRVTIDGLVIARERWMFAPAEIDAAELATPVDRFVGVRRWAAEHGLPRFVFVKSAAESKPTFLDLDSPLSVEVFANLVRVAREDAAARVNPGGIAVTEMLPRPDQCWLVDADGRRYTSELRMVTCFGPDTRVGL